MLLTRSEELAIEQVLTRWSRVGTLLLSTCEKHHEHVEASDARKIIEYLNGECRIITTISIRKELDEMISTHCCSQA